uniref:Uncharacterized protein n=1 Tax=Manihot esculenta TaxID=3983 RepID=A0A2C9UR62_MANES
MLLLCFLLFLLPSFFFLAASSLFFPSLSLFLDCFTILNLISVLLFFPQLRNKESKSP